MKTKYECEFCGGTYDTIAKCADCESSHLQGVERILYNLKQKNEDPCDWCEHSFYVYGCERDCSQKCQNYNKFTPTHPLHNKR